MQSSDLYVIQRVQTEFRKAGFEYLFFSYKYSAFFVPDTVLGSLDARSVFMLLI